MTVAVPEAVAPAAQVLTEFRLKAKHRRTVLEFRLTAKHRSLESFVWDEKIDQ